MSREANKALARRIVEEMWNTQNLKIVDEVYSPEFGVVTKRPSSL